MFFYVAILCLIGIVSLYSASYQISAARGENYVAKQLIWMAVGTMMLFLAVALGYNKFLEWSYFIYIFSLFLLVLVLVAGKTASGAKRWLNFGGFSFQPSEFTKIAFILVLSRYMGDHVHLKKKRLKDVLVPLILCGIPVALILKEPNLGTATSILVILFFMLYAWEVPMKLLFSFIALGVLSTPLLWFMLKDYQRSRLLVFLNLSQDPLGAGYTITQSKIAIGSGGLLGKGWLSGTQNQLNFLPERHTDFIFSIIGEEWGFIGVLVVLGILLFFLLYIIRVIATTKDFYGKTLVAGFLGMFVFHIGVNIAMTAGFMPVVGIPLPFISYGGSYILTSLFACGFIISVYSKYR